MRALAPVPRRVRRFVATLAPRPDPGEMAMLAEHLAPAQLDLFSSMQPADQRHSLDVFRCLVERGHRDADLLTAALLHDAGKARARLRVWHRVAADLGQTFWPTGLRWLARGGPACLRQPIDVCIRHAELGAADARAAGCSDRVVSLIRGDSGPGLTELAAALRACDGAH